MIPGEYRYAEDPIVINAGKEAIRLAVVNRGDRPIQVGSHYHFAETNPALEFDRAAALVRRLDIPAGTAVRFEPGDERTVELIELGGKRRVHGFHNRVNRPLEIAEATDVEVMAGNAYSFARHGSNDNQPHAVDEEA